MEKKETIRKKYLLKRKKKYFNIHKKIFFPLKNLLKKKFNNKKISISLYYPTSYELNILRILDLDYFAKSNILLPIIEDNKSMNFYKWNKNQILTVNKHGILEPIKTKIIFPKVILVPLLAFDSKKNRLGYGKGFYDKYLNKYIRRYKKILTIGVAFSFQKHHNLPVNKYDAKLDYILTEKGIF